MSIKKPCSQNETGLLNLWDSKSLFSEAVTILKNDVITACRGYELYGSVLLIGAEAACANKQLRVKMLTVNAAIHNKVLLSLLSLFILTAYVYTFAPVYFLLSFLGAISL